MYFKIPVAILLTLFFTGSLAEEKATIKVEKIYAERVKTYDEKGSKREKVNSDLVLHAAVQNGGLSNDIGLIEVQLNNGAKTWIKASHVKITYTGKVCTAVEPATTDVDSMSLVSSGWGVDCDE